MEYVVYHTASTQMIKIFNSLSSVKRSCTCMNRNARHNEIANPVRHGLQKEPYAWAELEYYYAHIVTKRKVKSLMTGKEVAIDSNTPLSCDPSSETFWSM